MFHSRDEEMLLDEQEALACAGIERAVRGLGIDVMDALSLPNHWREHELFDVGVASAAQAITSETTMKLIAASIAGKVAQPGNLPARLRRACIASVLSFTSSHRADG
jgi:hypothetical protein